MTQIRKAALYYARELGWPVFPVWPVRDGKCACGQQCGRNAGKHPISIVDGITLTEHGVDDATTDLTKIDWWWTVVPDANIGCRGEKWFALDVDDVDALHEIEDGYGRLPDTPRSFSGSGGTHIFFKQQDPLLGNKRGKLPSKIDVRGAHGYCILPPSSHVEGSYDWEISSKPNDVSLADPPDWLLELIGIYSEPISVEFASDSKAPELDSLDVSPVIRDTIRNGPTQGADRSQLDQRVIVALTDSGLGDGQIHAIYNKYPIGIAGKYAEKGQHGDSYLAGSIANARAWLSTHTTSRAIPGKIITQEEADIECEFLQEVYHSGWNDALLSKPELVDMWPEYLGFNNKNMVDTMISLYGIGFRKDYSVDESDREYPALAVPMTDAHGDISNIDYSIYKTPGGINPRQWEVPNAPVFLADTEQMGKRMLLILDDWDTAIYVYLTMSTELPDDIIIASMSKEIDAQLLTIGQLAPLLDIAKEAEEVVFIRSLNDKDEVKWLSQWIGTDKTKWIGWPFSPREMIKGYGMRTKQFRRALRGAVPIA